MIGSRLTHFVHKRIRARRLGLSLYTSKGFSLPDHIVLHNMRKAVRMPDENGVKVAFMEVLFADNYGLEKIAEPVKTVLDIGANVGIFCLAARHAFPHAVIHAYEPNPHLEPYLRVQATAANCRYYMEAVDRDNGRVSLDLHPDSVQTKSRPDDSGAIPAVAFREASARLGGNVDLAKIDCEGAEWRLWQDAAAWQHVRHLVVEYHLLGTHTHGEARDTVAGLGFGIQLHETAPEFGLIHARRAT